MRWTTEAPAARLRRLELRRIRLSSWHFYFVLWPRRLSDDNGTPGATWVCLETVARRAKDKDGRRPWVFGNVGLVLKDP